MFQGNVYVCTLKFQSLKRDHSSSDLLWKDSLASSSKVSIAQARPFLFRPDLSMRGNFADSSFNRSSATIPLPTASAEFLSSDLRSKFQSLKRDHSSSDTSAMGRPLRLRSSRVSIAQARPFLFRPFYRKTMDDRDAWFQSLKRDHSSSDVDRIWPGLHMYRFQSLKRDHSSSDPVSRENRCIPSSVSIAQARPFLFRRSLSQRRAVFSESFNRSSATIPLPTAASRNAQAGSIELCFNRSSATIPLPTARAKSTGTRAELRFNRSSATIPLPTCAIAAIGSRPICFNRSSATIPLPTRTAPPCPRCRHRFQSLKRDHSSSDIAFCALEIVLVAKVSIAQARPFLFRRKPAALMCATASSKFQSLKRDHSSSDKTLAHDLRGRVEVSIAQARPFLFRRDIDLPAGQRVDVSIAQARPFLFRPGRSIPLYWNRACFNRSSATIPLPTRRRGYDPVREAAVSIAQARPFLFRRRRKNGRWHDAHVSIAQARPFLFRLRKGRRIWRKR